MILISIFVRQLTTNKKNNIMKSIIAIIAIFAGIILFNLSAWNLI